MKNCRTRLAAILLLFALFASLLPAAAAAYDAPFQLESSKQWYDTLSEAVAAAAQTDTIWVYEDATLSAPVTISGKALTLSAPSDLLPARMNDNSPVSTDETAIGVVGTVGADKTAVGAVGATILRGEGCEGSMITVEEGASLTVRGLTLDGNCGDFAPDFEQVEVGSGGMALIPVAGDFTPQTVNGAIIHSLGDLTFERATLQNGATTKESLTDTSYQSGGGAVYMGLGSFQATDSLFYHNFATLGGAICCNSKSGNNQHWNGHVENFSCDNCVFKDNFCGRKDNGVSSTQDYVQHGGAIFLRFTKNNNFTNCSFETNTVSVYNGGAIMVSGSNETNTAFNATNCDFTGNTSGNDGCAVHFLYWANSSFTNCNFKENRGLGYQDTGTSSSVGTISWLLSAYTRDTVHTITNCTFEKNDSVVLGDHGCYLNLTVKNSEFIDNNPTHRADERSYNLLLFRSSNVLFEECEFRDNWNNICFAAIRNDIGYEACTGKFVRCDFTHNEGIRGLFWINNDDTFGTKEGEECSGFEITLEDCNITDNHYTAGLIKLEEYGKMTLNNCTLTGNTANPSEPDEYFRGGIATLGINNSTTVRNDPNTTELTLNNCVVTGNSTTNYGGAICAAGGAVVTIDSATQLYGNHADVAGDDIYCDDTVTLNLGATPSGMKLPCGDYVTGWFDDSAAARWNRHDSESEINAVEVAAGTYAAQSIALKAAHGELKPTMSYATTFSYIEPWSLKFAVALKLDGYLIPVDDYTDYGAYVLVKEDVEGVTAPTPEEMLAQGTQYSGTGEGWERATVNKTERVRLNYDKELYTYQLDRHIYVMMYVTFNGQTYYGSVKDRQELAILKSIAETAKAGDTRFTASQRRLVNSILTFYDAYQQYLQDYNEWKAAQ